MRFVDPEQTLFQFGRAIQRPHVVVCQRTFESADKGWWKSMTSRIQHAQVGKKIGLGCGFFPAGAMVDLWFALEQGTYVHKDVEDLIFAPPDFFAVYGAVLAPIAE